MIGEEKGQVCRTMIGLKGEQRCCECTKVSANPTILQPLLVLLHLALLHLCIQR